MGYGGLELVSDLQRWPKGYDGLEVRVEQGKEVPITRGGLCPVSVPEMPWPSIPDDGLVKADGPKDAKRICGMRPIVFWPLLVVAILIVVIAAVGGGIGGSYLANRGKRYVSLSFLGTSSHLTHATAALTQQHPSRRQIRQCLSHPAYLTRRLLPQLRPPKHRQRPLHQAHQALLPTHALLKISPRSLAPMNPSLHYYAPLTGRVV